MLKQDLVLAVRHRYPQCSLQEAALIVETFFSAITKALQRGETVEIREFGTFGVKQRQGRAARNPRTGAVVEVEAKKTVFFRAAQGLRQAVKGQQ